MKKFMSCMNFLGILILGAGTGSSRCTFLAIFLGVVTTVSGGGIGFVFLLLIGIFAFVILVNAVVVLMKITFPQIIDQWAPLVAFAEGTVLFPCLGSVSTVSIFL